MRWFHYTKSPDSQLIIINSPFLQEYFLNGLSLEIDKDDLIIILCI